MKRTLGMNSILKKDQWWEITECIINRKGSI